MAGGKEKNGRILQKFIQGYVRIRGWQCSRRVLPMQNFQGKTKRVLWIFPTEFVQNTLTIPEGGITTDTVCIKKTLFFVRFHRIADLKDIVPDLTQHIQNREEQQHQLKGDMQQDRSNHSDTESGHH